MGYIVFTYTFHLWGKKSETGGPASKRPHKKMLRDWPTGQKLGFNEKQHEHACFCRRRRFGRFSLDAGAECFAATAPADSSRRKSRGSRLRGHDGCLRKLRSFSSCSARQRSESGRSIFWKFGSDSTVG